MVRGWRCESERHSLSAKGIRTGRKLRAEGIATEGLSEPETEDFRIVYKLPVEQIVYVPSTFDNMPVSSGAFERRVKETRDALAVIFGGYTSVEGMGGYSSEEDGIVHENVVRVISYTNRKEYESKRKELFEFLKEKQDEWGQESIGFEVEGDMFYLSGKE